MYLGSYSIYLSKEQSTDYQISNYSTMYLLISSSNPISEWMDLSQRKSRRWLITSSSENFTNPASTNFEEAQSNQNTAAMATSLECQVWQTKAAMITSLECPVCPCKPWPLFMDDIIVILDLFMIQNISLPCWTAPVIVLSGKFWLFMPFWQFLLLFG